MTTILIGKFSGDLLMENVNITTLNKVQDKLKSVAKEILKAWDLRQKKTVLQEKTINAFGIIHNNSATVENHQDMFNLLHEVIESLPPAQREQFDTHSCHEGFIDWNEHWKKFALTYDQDLPIRNVHLAYQNWTKRSVGKFVEFKELFENCMIRSTSEAVCETVGSLMKIHAGRNRHLQPLYYSMEIVLRWNIAPLHLLRNLVNDVYNREKKEYIRRTKKTNKIVTGIVAKSASTGTFEEKSEAKSHFPASFWLKPDKN